MPLINKLFLLKQYADIKAANASAVEITDLGGGNLNVHFKSFDQRTGVEGAGEDVEFTISDADTMITDETSKKTVFSASQDVIIANLNTLKTDAQAV